MEHPPRFGRNFQPPGPADLEARISFLPTAEGGLQRPYYSGIRPNHDFGLPHTLNDGMHQYPDEGEARPGTVVRALIWLVAPRFQKGRLYPGFKFNVQEGARVVGRGEVTAVLNGDLACDVQQEGK